MKILLINAPWVNTQTHYGVKAGSRWANIRNRQQNLMYYPFPFSLAYACSLLKSNGYDAIINDAIAQGFSSDQAKEYAIDLRPDIVVVETSTPSIYSDLKFCEELKNTFNPKIVLSGNHATALPREMLGYSFVDFVLLGEYEFVLLDLVKNLENHEKIKGLAYNKNGQVVVNSRRELISDLDELPFPYRDQGLVYKYNDPFCKGYPNLPMLASRGCPYTCIFCLEPYVYYGKPNYRIRKVKNIVDEIELLKLKYKIREVYFDDSSLTIDKNFITKLCNEILERKLDIQWSCMADARTDFETLELMKRSGCVGLKFGVESANTEILNAIQKPLTLETVKKFVKFCNILGLYSHGTYMFGLPKETKYTIKKTIDFAFSLNSTSSQFSIATPLPGTKFYEMAEVNNWLLTKDWSKYEGANSSVVKLPGLEPQEILDAIRYAKKKRILQILKRPAVAFNYLIKIYRMQGLDGIVAEMFKKLIFLLRK